MACFPISPHRHLVASNGLEPFPIGSKPTCAALHNKAIFKITLEPSGLVITLNRTFQPVFSQCYVRSLILFFIKRTSFLVG